MRISLIRHGKTAANATHLYCGSTDLPLSESGLAELNALLSKSRYPEAPHLYTSGMLRTRQTLNAIYGDISSTDIPALSEMDFGRFEMHSYDELKADPDYLAWITDDTGSFVCPGGESSNAFKARVFKAFDELVKMGDDALIVCHGGVIAQLMPRLFPKENKNFYEWQPSAGRGYTIYFQNGHAAAYEPIPIAR